MLIQIKKNDRKARLLNMPKNLRQLPFYDVEEIRRLYLNRVRLRKWVAQVYFDLSEIERDVLLHDWFFLKIKFLREAVQLRFEVFRWL